MIEYLGATTSRSTPVNSGPWLNATLTDCSIPNSRKATKILAKVSTLRMGLRYSAAQMRPRYFMLRHPH